ncbi:MAG: Hsp20/alpha crystallin family protein, partial [Pirellulaceae bacterium]|nr:Hsp20/alpha crystallin family protein [Pirellulaceae bacterium]
FNLIPWKKRRDGIGSVSGEPVERQLTRLRDEFDSLLNRFWNEGPSLGGDWFSRGWGLDVDENDSEYLVRTEAPGFEAGEFDVQVRGDQLVIRAEHKEESKEEAGSAYHHGTFYRSLPLPLGVEPDKIDARYRNGILELHLPKGEKSRGKRIAVKPT